MMNSLFCAALAAGLTAAPVRAEEAPAAEKVFEADKESDQIDVSQYPKEQRKSYSVFSEKCSKCHTLARPINSDYALPSEWAPCVEKMRKKKHSGINADAQKIITDFLIYDSSVRKKDLIAQKEKLKKESAPEAKPAEGGAPEAKKEDAGK